MPDTTSSSPAPLRFDPSFERPEEDEAATDAALVETMRGISETTFKDYGRAVRSVHAKGHGLLRGELRVLGDLPETLAQGVYARPGASFPVAMRFSTNPRDLLHDSINVTVPRGLAIKLAGVEGERLPGSEGAATQDYVLVNAPAFAVPDARAFLSSLKPLAASTDTPQVLKKVAGTVLRAAERVVEAVGRESPMLKTMGGAPPAHPLGETYYSQVPLLHGPYVAKISVAPVSPELVALTGATLKVGGRPDALRDELGKFFRSNGAEWEVRVQLCNDLGLMPIEDATVAWPEDRSPYHAVARITVRPQEAWSAERAATMDEGLAFSPWHGLAAHRPVGSIMRARKAAYEMSARFRGERNGCPMHEPRSAGDLPG